MSKRDRKQTHMHTSLMHSPGATSLGDVGYGDTVSILNDEGTLSSNHSEKRIISNRRVPVVAPDGEPLMSAKSSMVRRWIRYGEYW